MSRRGSLSLPSLLTSLPSGPPALCSPSTQGVFFTASPSPAPAHHWDVSSWVPCPWKSSLISQTSSQVFLTTDDAETVRLSPALTEFRMGTLLLQSQPVVTKASPPLEVLWAEHEYRWLVNCLGICLKVLS